MIQKIIAAAVKWVKLFHFQPAMLEMELSRERRPAIARLKGREKTTVYGREDARLDVIFRLLSAEWPRIRFTLP